MHRRAWVFLLLALSGVALAEQAKSPPAEAPAGVLKGFDANGGKGKRLHEVPIEGEIDLGLASFVERVVGEAKPGDVVLARVKTFGGRVDAAVRIRDALLASKAPTVCYVDQRAISAGALISLACDTLLMSPGSSIGAATPVLSDGEGKMETASEKVVSYMRAEMRATAVAKGRRADLAEAMVNPDVEIPGVSPKGKLLTLTSDEALKLGLAQATPESYEASIPLLHLEAAERLRGSTDWGETLARLLTNSVVSSLLMTLGMLGLVIEFFTPGFGLAGISGIVCLALFFLGQYAARLAGWEEVILFGVGLALLLLEIFVIPGFGVVGVLGLALIGASLVMSLMEVQLPWSVSWDLGYVQESFASASIRLLLLLVIIVIAVWVLSKYFPKTKLGHVIILGSATDASAGYVAEPQSLPGLLGCRGPAASMLRPSGIAELDGRRVDVVTEGDFVEKGTEVEVVRVDGNRVVVKKVTVA